MNYYTESNLLAIVEEILNLDSAMRFVAMWAICDSVVIIVSSALKGAGDTRFIMVAMTFLSVGVLVVPTYLVIDVFEMDLGASCNVGVIYMLAT